MDYLRTACLPSLQIRSVYRTIEISQGFRGTLGRCFFALSGLGDSSRTIPGTSERFFYALDTLPLFIAIAVYVPFWPGRFLPPMPTIVTDKQATRVEAQEMQGRESAGTAVDADAREKTIAPPV
jgi:hypothetical protein